MAYSSSKNSPGDFGFTDLHGLKDYVGFVILCAHGFGFRSRNTCLQYAIVPRKIKIVDLPQTNEQFQDFDVI